MQKTIKPDKKRMETNIIYCGDCKDVLKKIPDESIDLIYLDPPFFSQKHYENFWAVGGGDAETKLAFSDKDWEKLRHSIDPNILREYEHIEQRWKGGHSKGIYVYIAYMRERLIQCERVLKKTGSIYLHCDWHASHYLKVMMDEIFGYDNFKNDIAWCYKEREISKTRWNPKHDSILFYTKGDKYTFNWSKVTTAYSEGSIRKFNLIDENGRAYQIRGKGDKYVGEQGLSPEIERKHPEWTYRDYLDEKPGVLGRDWWDDIPFINRAAIERTGYPTQKPEKLLEKILIASSNVNDIILDPFCGCGTTLAVAKKLGRQFIGIDISRVACDVMKERLGGNIPVIGGESPEELAKMNPHEFARLVIVEKMGGIINPKKSGDMGIDGWIEFKTVPVQVKRWEHKVGRPEIDKFKTAIERDKKDNGIMVAADYSKDCHAEVARIEKEHKIKIRLLVYDDVFNW